MWSRIIPLALLVQGLALLVVAVAIIILAGRMTALEDRFQMQTPQLYYHVQFGKRQVEQPPELYPTGFDPRETTPND